MGAPEVARSVPRTAFMSPVSVILVIFFLRSQDKSKKRLFPPHLTNRLIQESII